MLSYTFFQNGRNQFSSLLFTCKLALVAWFKENIILHLDFKNEAKRADLQGNKRILERRPFWNKVYPLKDFSDTIYDNNDKRKKYSLV